MLSSLVLLLTVALSYTAVLDIISTQTCKIHSKPYPSGVDVCAYFHADKYGLTKSLAVYRLTFDSEIKYAVHGWFPATIYDKLSPLPFEQFKLKNFEIFDINYYDTFEHSFTISCGVYREYLKHGAASGYSFDYWHSVYTNCSKLSNRIVNPRLCRFDSFQRVNCLEETFETEVVYSVETTDCKAGYSYRTCTD
jgi:hypothetical protein